MKFSAHLPQNLPQNQRYLASYFEVSTPSQAQLDIIAEHSATYLRTKVLLQDDCETSRIWKRLESEDSGKSSPPSKVSIAQIV